VADNELRIEPGKTNEIKVTITRLHDWNSKLSVSAKGLPAGLKAEQVEVPDKEGQVVLKLVASPDAKPFSGPIQVVVTVAESGQRASCDRRADHFLGQQWRAERIQQIGRSNPPSNSGSRCCRPPSRRRQREVTRSKIQGAATQFNCP
jgi:hypothetical protein